MKPKRLGRGLKGLIKSSDPESLPPSRKSPPPSVEPTVPPPEADEAADKAADKAAGVPTPDAVAAEAPAIETPPVETPRIEPSAVEAPPPEVPAAEVEAPAAPAGDGGAAPVAVRRGVEPAPAPAATPAAASSSSPSAVSIRHIPVAEVRPNPYQPRMHFAEDDLAELQASIDAHGVLQPVVVRPAAVGFELIAGERRLRASEALGLDRIPAIVRRAADEEMQTLALVENLQRVDLNALEKAKALKAMMRNFGLTQEEVATKVGKARTSISNLVRLLELPVVIQDLVSDGHLSGSQARAVLLAHGAERRIALAQRAVKQGLTVRQIERLAKAERAGATEPAEVDPYVADLEGRLKEALGTRVQLKPKGKGGAIVIGYHDANELDRLLGHLGAS